MTSRQTILDLLSGKTIDSQPAFSGLIHVTAEGLRSEGISLPEAHTDATKMARASASTFKLSGLPSAVAPLDMCVEAEAIGASIDFRHNGDSAFPRVTKPLFPSVKFITSEIGDSFEILNRGRIRLVCEALELIKDDIGSDAVIGGMIPGPFTLLLFLIEPGGLFADMKRDPGTIREALFHLSSFLSRVAQVYRNAGADFITIHDMGGSPGFIGPAKYESFVFPAEKHLIEQLQKPCVLSICGNTNKSLHLLAQTGAGAISVDQLNDLAETRQVLTSTRLFGNIDPVATLWQGDQAAIAQAVRVAKQAGVDAVWPGCDLVPQTPPANIRILMESN
ncbi:MAG TPA: uroporphyrinogen decarboxylase family protein [Anaerolineales bacterium]|nr:uroporphyrinogen decarboxylase family protein [Anaerolineales bacterium]